MLHFGTYLKKQLNCHTRRPVALLLRKVLPAGNLFFPRLTTRSITRNPRTPNGRPSKLDQHLPLLAVHNVFLSVSSLHNLKSDSIRQEDGSDPKFSAFSLCFCITPFFFLCHNLSPAVLEARNELK